MTLVLVGLVVVPEDIVVFTQQHLFRNMGQHFESFSQNKPRSFTKPHKTFTKPLTTFEILTILCGLVETGPSTWEAEGWDNQHDYMKLVSLGSKLKQWHYV